MADQLMSLPAPFQGISILSSVSGEGPLRANMASISVSSIRFDRYAAYALLFLKLLNTQMCFPNYFQR